MGRGSKMQGCYNAFKINRLSTLYTNFTVTTNQKPILDAHRKDRD